MISKLWTPNRRRHLVGTVLICTIVGLMLYLMRGGAFGLNMLYAFTVGMQISVYIVVLQDGLATVLSRWWPNDTVLREGWVGWPWLALCVVLGAGLGYAGGLWLGDTLSGRRSAYPWEQNDLAAGLTLGFVLLLAVLGTAGFFTYFRLQELKVKQADTQRQAAEAHLTLLQSQLEPHMLFNTLAHLRALIKRQPDEAQAMLDQLIAFLRATLQASRAGSHSLAEEFARLSDYLALMQQRMGARLQVELVLPPELEGVAIPPLLLQPLVENAIKHGLESHVEGGRLRVVAARTSAGLTLQVSDNGSGLRHAAGIEGTGFGLAQVRERLLHRYGDAARLELSSQPSGGSIALITIREP